MRLPFQLQALSQLAIVRLSLIFAVIWGALALAAVFGLVRARLDVGQTAAVEASLAVTAISQALAQAPGLYDAPLQASLGAIAPQARRAILAHRTGAANSAVRIPSRAPVQPLVWTFDRGEFRPIVGQGAVPRGHGLYVALVAGRPIEGPVLVGGRAGWARLQPVGARGRILGAYAAAVPFKALDGVVSSLAATPTFARGFVAITDSRGRLLFAATGADGARARSGLLDKALVALGRLGRGYQLASASSAGGDRLQVVAGVSQAELNVQTLSLVGGSQSFLAMVIVVSLTLAWLLAGRLSGAVEAAETSRAAALAAQAEAERAGEALTDELRQAARYVASLLPAKSEAGPVATDWLYRPSLDLGGDAFGYLWLDDRRFAFYLLDVCGHGVGPALLASAVMNVIRAKAVGADLGDPSSVLAALNQAFAMERQNDLYFTLWYGVYDLATGTIRYASGGHHPAVLIAPNEKPMLLQGRGPPVGCFAEAVFPAFTAEAPVGSQIYVFSDGLFEVELADGRGMLSLEAFVEILVDRRARSPRRVLAAVLEAIQIVQGQDRFEDDCSMLQISLQQAERSRLLA